MKTKLTLLVAAALLAVGAPVQAQVATFEGLPHGGTFVTNGHAGKDWQNWVVFQNGEYGTPTPAGSDFGLIYCCGNINSVTNTGGGAFDFFSALVADAQHSDSFTAFGYDANNVLIYSQLVNVSPTWHTETFNFLGISRLEFSTDNSTNMELDEMNFGEATVTPEPATISLLGLGLVGVFGAARRRRKTA